MQPNSPEQIGAEQRRMMGLMGKFDADPGRYRPLYYGVQIDVGSTLGQVGRGSITINNQPYIMTHVLHQMVGSMDPEISGLTQDGQYLINFKDEQSNYQNVPLPADMLFGSVRSGYIVPLAYPIPFAGNKTLTFELTNTYTRTLPGSVDTFKVYVAIAGVADWGDLR